MSSASQSLTLLLDQAEKARDDALARLEEARRSQEGARRQMQSLGDFRQQYQDRWKSQFNRLGGVEILRCYQDFMARLGEAEQDQQLRCTHLSSRVTHAQREVMDCEQRLMSITRLRERREQSAMAQQLRQEQKATDETAARAKPQSPFSTSIGLATAGGA